MRGSAERMEEGTVLLLLSLISACEGGRQDEECSSHCSSKFDQNLSCWNKTAHFFNKALLDAFLRYVTTQKSIERMTTHRRNDYSYKDGIVTTELINKTITTFGAASFKAINGRKEPALLPCPKGCEKSSEFWLSCNLISLLLSGFLLAILIIGTLEKDRIDKKCGVVEETRETDKRKDN
ncbi:unnamed protein product [Litomosoides sigmodontis]|uniref:Uncharacterized protein n=1 Tax=Litomosoides sigmodontis TaxID=42156 RepID=A0A3P6SLX1_LITSI|nr:unnamed protein product [Litomosoides sigmodontis]